MHKYLKIYISYSFSIKFQIHFYLCKFNTQPKHKMQSLLFSTKREREKDILQT